MTIVDDLRAALDPVALFEAAFGVNALDWQRGYLREDRPVALVKGRQVGASLAAAALAIHVVRYHDDVNAIIVSPSLKQSTEIATRARTGLRNLGVGLLQDSISTLRLANGSRILSLPGTARSVRGWTAQLLVIDEAAYVDHETIVLPQAEEAKQQPGGGKDARAEKRPSRGKAAGGPARQERDRRSDQQTDPLRARDRQGQRATGLTPWQARPRRNPRHHRPMTEDDETTTLRRWLWLQRIVLFAASAAGVLALAIIQASDRTSSPRLVLPVTIGAVFAGGLIGAMVATTVMTRRGISVQRPRSRARFVAIFGIALLLWLILSLLAPRLGLHSPYLGAALFAIFPLLGLLATELVDGITLRLGD